MGKVLFFNSPLFGHVIPTLPIVQELVARGEQVNYCLTDEFANLVRATGASFSSYRSTMNKNQPHGRFSRLLVDECQYVLPQMIESVRSDPPDYIIYEASCLWGHILSHAFQVPIISCRASLAVNKHFSHIPYLLDMNGSFSGNAFKLLLDTLQDFAALPEFCATYRLPCPEQNLDNALFHSEDLNIIFVSRLLQPAADTFDERFVFVGPPISHHATFPGKDALFEVPSRPTLYISLGTIYNAQPDFYRLCIQAFDKQPWRVVMALGEHFARSELEPVPENFLLQASVRQLDILQHSAIFITHGGLNSIHEALYYGVPMVIVPQMPEQVITAQRIEELGLGIVVEKETLTAAGLMNAVQTLSSDTSLLERMKQAQEEVQASGGVQRAADAILQFVQGRYSA